MLRPIAAFCLCVALHAQEPLHFEVASVKPSTLPAGGGSTGKSGKGSLTMTNVTLKRMIMGAFAIGQNQIAGGPDWLDTDRFEIVAKAQQPVGDSVLMPMLQTLLAERFSMKYHRESRPTPAYVLDVGKNGTKLEKAEGEDSATSNGRGRIDAKGVTMDRLAELLSRQMDLPVVNRTGLDGAYNVNLEWVPETVSATADNGPSIFSAVQKFGLRLRSEKVPIEVIVIDHVERPTGN